MEQKIKFTIDGKDCIADKGLNLVDAAKENGIYILETMNTGPLLRDGVNEFMFVLGQPRIIGSVQAMVNPVALY